MKTFSLLLVIIVVSTTALSAPTEKHKLQSVILKEILDNVRQLNATFNIKTKTIMVQEVITTKNCSLEYFCKAGNVLGSLKAEALGIKEQVWLLPRLLVAYTRNIQCENPAPDHSPSSPASVELQHLLKNIRQCAQKMNAHH
ncbi:hypothetical protein AMEX_G4016 [Astyanax mexicanus]|uniref:Interleukin-4 n=1 Tax=Astyanax mexicanus TaxID=7994 RepID=A0A8T2MD35_ASTMX|nr:hypothetical protein AMEX_G4016 [Astyanax mexicanus]